MRRFTNVILKKKANKMNENLKYSIKNLKLNIYKDCSHNDLMKQEINNTVRFDDHKVYVRSTKKKCDLNLMINEIL